MKIADQRRRTVYPPEWAVEVTGWKAPDLNSVIMRHATMTLLEIANLEYFFTAEEWLTLLSLFRGFRLSETDPEPAHTLSQVLVAEYGGATDLATKVVNLSYTAAWTIHLLVNSVRGTSPPEGWWTRQAFVARRHQEFRFV